MTINISSSPGKPVEGQGDRGDLSSPDAEAEAEPENSDQEADREYVPMDFFVCNKLRKQHFQLSSIRRERRGARSPAA